MVDVRLRRARRARSEAFSLANYMKLYGARRARSEARARDPF